ncbi:hypothetical protein B0H16DRAFT_1715383 [Mycena metata]|uniref:Uncharacterized protein n=1 Tax=Mycena metata TaxID=1033252 RepID=A0AAD7JS28_9AGAR|nr:hypothetical protein B0H16DRAFT_1715383 [Mycena metata]
MTDLTLVATTSSSGPMDEATFSAPPTKADQATLLSALHTLSDSVAAVSTAVAAIGDAPLSQGIHFLLPRRHIPLNRSFILAIGTLADLAAAGAAAEHAAAELRTAVAAFQPPPPPAVAGNMPPPGFLQSEGPWKAGILYSVVPREPLAPTSDTSDKWFAITRGKYVGITKNSALSINAVIGVGSALSDRCSTLDEALDLFNTALAGNAIALLR